MTLGKACATSGQIIRRIAGVHAVEIETKFASSRMEQGSVRLDRRRPAADQVYRFLRDAIITCRLEPNEAISENRICGIFKISRSPVRTAITRLAEDGLIEIYPQRGTFVAPIKLKQVHEAQFARSALEVSLAEEAARHWTDEHSILIKANLELQALHAKSGDGRGFFSDNEAFHQLIARAAKLEGVWATVQSVKMLWDRIGHIANREPAHTLDIIAEHCAIVKALDQRSPKMAAEAMRQHLQSVDQTIARLRPLHESYFSDQ
jgi:GntR family transcriptional regulator, rspAB operon transcriptional repressor